VSALTLSPLAVSAPAVRLRRVTTQAGGLTRIPFLIIASLVLVGGLVGLLILTTTIQAQSRHLRDLQTQVSALNDEQAALSAEVGQLRSATHLVEAASALGMRPNPHPAMIALADGTVYGVPAPADGNALPDQVWNGPVTQPTPAPIRVMPPPTPGTEVH